MVGLVNECILNLFVCRWVFFCTGLAWLQTGNICCILLLHWVSAFFWRQKVDSLGLVSAILLKGHSWQTHKKWLMFNGSRSFEIKLDTKYLEDKAQCMFSPEIEVCFCRKSPKMYLILGIWKMFFEIQYLRFPVFLGSESWCRWVFFCAGLIWLLTGITCCGQLVICSGKGVSCQFEWGQL